MNTVYTRVSGRSAKESGYTLIEIVVVLALIGILCAIAIPNLVQRNKVSNDIQVEAHINRAVGIAEDWRRTHPNDSQLQVPLHSEDAPPVILVDLTADNSAPSSSILAGYNKPGNITLKLIRSNKHNGNYYICGSVDSGDLYDRGSGKWLVFESFTKSYTNKGASAPKGCAEV